MARVSDIDDIRARLLARFDVGVHPSLGVPDEWLAHLGVLDTALAALDPGYTLFQVKTKFGGLRYYANPSPPAKEPTVAYDATITGTELDLQVAVPGVGATVVATRADVRPALRALLAGAGVTGPARVHMTFTDVPDAIENRYPEFVPHPTVQAMYALITAAEDASYRW